MFVVQPASAIWFGHYWESLGKPLPDGFRYTSNTNTDWLDVEQINARRPHTRKILRRKNSMKHVLVTSLRAVCSASI